MSNLSRRAVDRSGYLSHDTIAAIATQLGGAIGMIRVSGPAAREALESLVGKGALSKQEPRRLFRARLKAPGVESEAKTLDDAMVAYFVAPDSFTGEDCVELYLHGSSVIAIQVMEALSSLGVRQALPGEFSFRAVRNGKMNVSQAEAVADLIASANPEAASLALEKLEGSQSRFVAALAEELRQLATLGEVGIDFADQDVDEVSLPRLKERVTPILAKLESLKNSYSRGVKLQDGVRVAFVGLPNAGKSSFFNALLGEDRSIVSDIAGTTRDVVRERLTLQGKNSSITLRLEDTAGLRHSEDAVEKIGIERTINAAREADLVLLIVDAQDIGPKNAKIDSLRQQWKALGEPKDRAVGILTKVDLLSSAQKKELDLGVREFGIHSWVGTSALTHHGIHEAAAMIADFSEKWVHRSPGEVVLTRLEHQEAVSQTIDHLNRSKEAAEIDLFASDLRQALFALSPLIGETLPDDLLGRIFSQFCIGK